jgi:hypothetical protein
VKNVVDLFGRSFLDAGVEVERRFVPTLDQTGLPPWKCHVCLGAFPASERAEITVVGKTFVLYFCSDECADEAGYSDSVRLRRLSYEAGGPYAIIVTPEGRLPDPATQWEEYRDVFLLMYLEDELSVIPFIAGARRLV